MLSQKMKLSNYIILDNPGIFNKKVMYIDTKDFLADSILGQSGVKIHFGPHFENKTYKNYVVIVGDVRKSDIDKFKDCMSQLTKKQLIYQNTDYMEICEKIMEEIIDGQKRG